MGLGILLPNHRRLRKLHGQNVEPQWQRHASLVLVVKVVYLCVDGILRTIPCHMEEHSQSFGFVQCIVRSTEYIVAACASTAGAFPWPQANLPEMASVETFEQNTSSRWGEEC